jgi:hypothetical protein
MLQRERDDFGDGVEHSHAKEGQKEAAEDANEERKGV